MGGVLKERSRATLAVLAVSRRARTITGFGFVIAGLLASIASMTLDSGAGDLTGRFGVLSTHVLFGLFGKAAYLFGPALIWSGFRGLARDDWSAYLSGVLGNLSVAWAVAVFFRLAGPTPAGIAGEYLALLLEFFTGRTGAYLINSLLLFTGVLLLLQIPFEDVKQKVVRWLEGAEQGEVGTGGMNGAGRNGGMAGRGASLASGVVTEHSNHWISRLLVLIPLAAAAYAIWSRFRAKAPLAAAEAVAAAVVPEAPAVARSPEPLSDSQSSAGGNPVFDRLVSRKKSSSVPPWFQRVEEPLDPAHSTGSALSRTVDDEIRRIDSMEDVAPASAAAVMGQAWAPTGRAGMVGVSSMSGASSMETSTPEETNVRNTHTRQVWRPGVGLVDEATSDDVAGAVWDDTLHSPTDGLIIEEDDFPFPDATGRARPAFSRRRDPSIIYDPERNRYLFRRQSEAPVSAGPVVEYLDEMELHMPDSPWSSELRNGKVELGRNTAGMSGGMSANAGAAAPESLQAAVLEETLLPSPVGEEEADEAVDEWEMGSPGLDEEGAADLEEQSQVMQDAPAAQTSSHVVDPAPNRGEVPPSSAMLFPVVFAEGRYSRYRLQRRVAKQSPRVESEDPEAEIRDNTEKLEKVMGDFGVQAKVTGAVRGPMITLYEVRPEAGVRVNRFHGIQDEIRMNLAAFSVRIVAPIPGKSTIGVELPNRVRQFVSMGDLVNGDPDFSSSKRELSIALGKDIGGVNRYLDLTRLPHLLIAGATGSGKSVFMNSVIASLLFNHSPDEVRFLMIDPKMVELKLFEGIPHLLHPVITDVRLADRALSWAVQEMESRYQLLSNVKCRDLRSYNDRIAAGELQGPRLPYIVLLIDELSDLMMVSAKEVEDSIIRLTQKARAVGIHVLMATQRPSVDVITSLIKANCPARISFQVAQKIDSRIILDMNGAESLLGKGDMLYKSPTAAEVVRIQSPMISEQEIEEIVQEACRYGAPRFIDLPGRDEENGSGDDAGDVDQVLVDAAWEIILESGKTSTSYVQRRLRIGYNRAATIIERLEQMGYLGPAIGNRPREIMRGRS